MFWIVCVAIFLIVILIIAAATSCHHEWKNVRSSPVTYRKLFTGDLQGFVVLDHCDKCKEYKAYMLTHEGEKPLDTKFVKAQFNI